MSETNGANGNGANGKEGKILCPISTIGNWHSESVPKMHHASPAELAAHGGICAACHSAISKRHVLWRHGKVETPADYSVLHHTQDPEDHIALDNQVAVKFVDFDFAALDAIHGEIELQPLDVGARAAEVLSRIFVWIWSNRNPRTALVKFSALSAGLRPDLVGRNQPALSRDLKVSKQAICKASVLFEKAFGITFSSSRSKEARQRFAAVQRGHPGATKRRRQPLP